MFSREGRADPEMRSAKRTTLCRAICWQYDCKICLGMQSFCLQVVDYYKETCRALENSETASMLGKIQKDWKKLVQMKIYYFAAIAHVSLLFKLRLD